jgi:hypothetical protein
MDEKTIVKASTISNAFEGIKRNPQSMVEVVKLALRLQW